MTFIKAVKSMRRAKVFLSGPSGSGKTYSALRLAAGIAGDGGRIAYIDTENRSSALNADKFSFDICAIDPPYTIDKYLDAIESAVKAGYDVLVIDSLSHAWAGSGGLLEQQSDKAVVTKNSYTAWRDITPQHNKLVESILLCPIHLIVCARSKQEYAMIQDSGKNRVEKLGMGVVQREGLEYEFDMQWELQIDHKAYCSKDRTGIFDQQVLTMLTEETGEQLREWVSTGAPIQPAIEYATGEQRRKINTLSKALGWSSENLRKWVASECGLDADQAAQTVMPITATDAERLIDTLEKLGTNKEDQDD